MAQIARREALRVAAERQHAPLDGVGEPALSDHDGTSLHEDVRQAVRLLGPDEQRALLARYWLDLTHEETAIRLGVPVGTVKVRLHRARLRMRDHLMMEP